MSQPEDVEFPPGAKERLAEAIRRVEKQLVQEGGTGVKSDEFMFLAGLRTAWFEAEQHAWVSSVRVVLSGPSGDVSQESD